MVKAEKKSISSSSAVVKKKANPKEPVLKKGSTSGSGNGSGNEYERELNKLKATIPQWNCLFSLSDEEEFMTAYTKMKNGGARLVDKYAWAVPDERALKIIKEFSAPAGVVEIGSGRGYWMKCLEERGVDIIGYDLPLVVDEDDGQHMWSKSVLKGGPEKLKTKQCKGRTLLLCYPDEANSLAMECLETLSPESVYIIHVGELMMSGTFMGGEQRPFGRTSTADFQVALAEGFHCILQAALPRFPHSRDCISVWKRTELIEGPDLDEDEDEGEGEDENEIEDENDADEPQGQGRNLWADIPEDERLSCDIASPCCRHLL